MAGGFIRPDNEGTNDLKQLKNTGEMQTILTALELSRLVSNIWSCHDDVESQLSGRNAASSHPAAKIGICEHQTHRWLLLYYYNDRVATRNGLYAFVPDTGHLPTEKEKARARTAWKKMQTILKRYR